MQLSLADPDMERKIPSRLQSGRPPFFIYFFFHLTWGASKGKIAARTEQLWESHLAEERVPLFSAWDTSACPRFSFLWGDGLGRSELAELTSSRLALGLWDFRHYLMLRVAIRNGPGDSYLATGQSHLCIGRCKLV